VIRPDRGSAPIEFVVVVVALLVPLVYLVQALASVAAAQLATVQAVREAARAFSGSATPAIGRRQALAAARLAFADQGVEWPGNLLRVSCPGTACLSPGSAVTVRMEWSAPLPWVPPALSSTARVPLSAWTQTPVDDYRDDPT
jgi:hypothetical protein